MIIKVSTVHARKQKKLFCSLEQHAVLISLLQPVTLFVTILEASHGALVLSVQGSADHTRYHIFLCTNHHHLSHECKLRRITISDLIGQWSCIDMKL